MDDDSLGDLSAVMGDDYGHGYDDQDGDPNVKPKVAKGPSVKNASHVSQTMITVSFPAQKQFLTKLVVQCLPTKSIPEAAKKANGTYEKPFDSFATTAAVGGRIVQPEDPITSVQAAFEGLTPGAEYIFRLVCTNPAGTSRGLASKAFVTLPATPPAPEFAYASAKSVSIKFPAQGAGISKLGIEMAVWCADPFGASNKKKGLLTDTSKNIGVRTTGLVRNLHPGKPYVFRLVVSNRAGTSVGPPSKPIKTLPRAPPPPREDPTQRTDKTIGLKFDKQGESITKLTLQYAVLAGKSTFDDVKKNGGREITLANPQEINTYLVKNLKPDQLYVFRLIAHNSSGKSTGQILGPIKTVTFTPDMLDKSGWLHVLSSSSKKTLGRRLSSSKKQTGTKYFYTIDGKLLSWSAEPKGEEVGFLHLGKVAEVTLQGNAIELKLKGPKAKALTLMGNSDDPNLTSEDMMTQWKDALVKAITGDVAVVAELKAAGSVKAAPVELPDSDEEDGDEEGFGAGADEEDEEEGGFELEDEDGFGGDGFEDSDEESDGGFGGDFGDADESDEEASGFD